MRIKKIIVVTIGALSIAVVLSATSAATSEEAARLKRDLTPLGAIRAGNRTGTIPPWTGGITKPPPNYRIGDHHPDPYPEEKPLFTISKKNLEQYKDRLSPGQVALLQIYASYKMKIYRSHRSASFPQRIYDATAVNATTAKLVAGGNGVTDTIMGIPFPIPKNGLEAIWNHILRYRGDTVRRFLSQATVTRNGSYVLMTFEDELDFLYSKPGTSLQELNNKILYFKARILSPARLAGIIQLVHEPLDQVKEPRMAWVYNPGQRRVRRAPHIAYDNPGSGSDGLRTMDQFDMFNGAPDRYDWKLVGKQELYVPYNSYDLHSDKLAYADIIRPLHINQDYARYELHRVWVVEANLKPNTRHIYARRTFYIDEDSWQTLIVDQYDTRGQLWRVSEGHVINFYDVPILWTTLETHYDLQSRRYIAIGLNNEDKMHDFNVRFPPSHFTPAAIRREGIR